MIKSFADKDSELIYNQEFSRRLPNTIQKVALRKLMMIRQTIVWNSYMEIELGNTLFA